MQGLTDKQLNLVIVGAIGAGLYWFFNLAPRALNAGQDALKPITDPIGKAIADIRYGAPGSGVIANQSYVILRARDISPMGQWSNSAYDAAVGMHQSNAQILQRILTPQRRINEPYLTAVKQHGTIAVYITGAWEEIT